MVGVGRGSDRVLDDRWHGRLRSVGAQGRWKWRGWRLYEGRLVCGGVQVVDAIVLVVVRWPLMEVEMNTSTDLVTSVNLHRGWPISCRSMR